MRPIYRNIILLVTLLTFTLAVEGSTRSACASEYSSSDALKTVGISVGVGSVLGLSTIGFYNQPQKHFGNVLIGAGAGLLVGLGLVAYMLTTSPREDDIRPEEIIKVRKQPVKEEKEDKNEKPVEVKKEKTSMRSLRSIYASRASVPAMDERQAYSAGAGWAVAFEVLELRF